MATFWEIAARSVDRLFSLSFLIAPVPGYCFSITFLIFKPGESYYRLSAINLDKRILILT